jgi:hypothetical protein
VTLHLIVRTDAEAQIASGYGWYEEERRGLGAEFVEELSFTTPQSNCIRFNSRE